MDGVALEIQPEALQAIAQKALDRQIGARGLRAIMEKIMTKIMFLIPSDLSIQKVIITPEAVEGADPGIVRDTAHPRKNLRAQIISLFFQGGSFSTPFFQKGGKNLD